MSAVAAVLQVQMKMIPMVPVGVGAEHRAELPAGLVMSLGEEAALVPAAAP